MSKREQMNRRKQETSRRNAALYTIAIAAIALAGVILFTRQGSASVHPNPRAQAEQFSTAHPDDFGAYPEAKKVYTMAQHIKSTLDGLFCHCHCKGAGHYSLLDCFRDDHGAGCDICLGEARLAYEMTQRGATLEEIRAAVDAQFGKS